MSARRPVPAETARRQALAADPAASAWVAANAGSGKTHVLVERVVRLLVAGTDPGRILCLTFTRAAAAEMASRVFARLAAFATMTAAELDVALLAIDGGAPDDARRAATRRLFARALETPGGLKIQTIHAFCASLLSRFPLEANVAGRFAVLDDQLAAELQGDAFAAVLAEAAAAPDGRFAGAIAALQPLLGDEGILEQVAAATRHRTAILAWVGEAGGLDAALAALASALGLAPGDTPERLAGEILDGRLLAGAALAGLAEALGRGGKTAQGQAAAIAEAEHGATTDERLAAWRRFLFDSKGNPRDFQRALTKAIADAHAGLAAAYAAEQDRVTLLLDRIAAARCLAATAALATLAAAVTARVEAEKRRRGLVDHGDLIARTVDLLSRSDAAAWVRFKLDQGIDHILVDEAQDTSPDQWRIVELLAEDFFTGAGARPAGRTVFAVGDEKQSIFGFQGAAPELFDRTRRRFAAATAAVGEAFHDVQLTLSFRSTPDVLAAVDAVFANPAAHAGLTHPPAPTVHEAIRAGEAGLVEVWPPEAPVDADEPDDWREPLDRIGGADPRVRLADRIAATIAGWIAEGEPKADGTPIGPGDVLVLVRKRGPIIPALSRALKRAGVPVAGADRLTLSEHVAVADLLALGRALATPADDLTLAALLRSPLFDVDEEALFRFAHGRTGTLHASLAAAAAAGDALAAESLARLDAWRTVARRGRPFELYARVLGRDGGRRRFAARLGSEVDEVLDAFLDQVLAHERVDTPTLTGFLAWFEAAPVEIRRETDTRPRDVRIMTVHGAKGLEAPVVFLIDDRGPPSHPSHAPSLFAIPLAPDRAPALLWVPRGTPRPAVCETELGAARERAGAEHRRLLYVALTRAADRLIVCGTEPRRAASPLSWAVLVETALAPDAEEVRDAEGKLLLWRWRAADRRTAAAAAGAGPAVAEAPPEIAAALPAWAAVAVAPSEAPEPLSPSRAVADGTTADTREAGEAAAPRPLDEAALRRGRMIHRLVELLAGRPAVDRPALARRFLAAEAGDLDDGVAAAIAHEVVTVLAEPAFAPLFGADGRAEVAATGVIEAADGRRLAVSARIDRLIVAPDAVTILDLKTDRQVPADAAAAPAHHVAQLALYRALVGRLYPALPVRAALLYTAGPRLLALDETRLDAALEALLATPHP